MKILVATVAGQGERASDFCWTIEGEPVVVPVQCGADRDDLDGGCGCRRSMTGLGSLRGTTTFTVADVPMTLDEYSYAILDSSERAGWGDDVEAADNAAAQLLDIASSHPTGAVLERRGDVISTRE